MYSYSFLTDLILYNTKTCTLSLENKTIQFVLVLFIFIKGSTKPSQMFFFLIAHKVTRNKCR